MRDHTRLHIGYTIVVICSFAWLIIACDSKKHDPASVEDAMQQYNRLILKLDADSIALLYTQDGNMGDMATGRDSIRHFLSSFKNVKVLLQTSTTASILINADTAVQKGNYRQEDVINGKDTAVVRGEFTTRWQWVDGAGWRIKRMDTKSTR